MSLPERYPFPSFTHCFLDAYSPSSFVAQTNIGLIAYRAVTHIIHLDPICPLY